MSVEDENEDLNTLDRGDALEEFDQARDEKGRFKAGEAGEEDEVEAEDEAEDEDEDEDESGEEGDKAAKGGDKNYPIRIRKAEAKLREERARAAALEQELAALKSGARQEPQEAEDPAKAINDALDVLYEQVEEARADGLTSDASKLQRKIDTLNRQLGAMEAEATARKVSAASTEGQRFDAMLDDMEAAVDVLNPKHEAFDNEAVKELEFQVAAYERMGMKPTAALAKAIKVLHHVDMGSLRAAAEPTEPKPKPTKKPDVAKAVDTMRRQPPDAGNRGVNRDDTKINVASLSDAEWDALPESKKAQMRGDIF